MKKLLLPLFLLTASCLCAQMETIDLGRHGRLTLYILGDWTTSVSDLDSKRTVTFVPKSEDVNARCELSFSFPPTDQFERKEKLKMRVEIEGEKFADMSVERKAVARPFNLATGYGFYCNFTDPELRGKPPKKGDYKTISVGMIRLAPGVLIEVGISADGFSSEPYQQLLGAIEGMEYQPAR